MSLLKVLRYFNLLFLTLLLVACNDEESLLYLESLPVEHVENKEGNAELTSANTGIKAMTDDKLKTESEAATECEASDVERLVSAFDGMAAEESIMHQVTCWAHGIPLHNPVRDECCPDFSCCNGGDMIPQTARTKLLEAHINNDNETVQKICMMGLSGLVSDLKVYVAGEDPTEH